MKLKIFYRAPIIWNMILFIIFSFLFIYIQSVFLNISSVLEQTELKNFLRNNLFIVSVFSIAIFSIYKLYRFASLFFIGVTLITTTITTLNLISQFSKINLVILFFYLLIAYYFLQFYLMEVNEAYYKSYYSSKNLFPTSYSQFSCKMIHDQNSFEGYLTNWTEDSCFINFQELPTGKYKAVELELKIEETLFKDRFDVVSICKKENGIGLKIKKKNKEKNSTPLGYKEFCEIMEEMGLRAEFIV